MSQEGISVERFFRFSTGKFQFPRTIPRIPSTAGTRSSLFLAGAQVCQPQTNFHKILNIRNNVILELLFCLGLRIDEISTLDPPHYDPVERTLFIHGKGRKGRLLHIPSPGVIEKLHAWLDIRHQLNPTDHAIFLNRYGNRLSIYGVENPFYKYGDLSSINPASTPCYLRYSSATQLLNNGASIRDVQELPGYVSTVTAQIYTEVSIDRHRQVLKKYSVRNFSSESQIIE